MLKTTLMLYKGTQSVLPPNYYALHFWDDGDIYIVLHQTVDTIRTLVTSGHHIRQVLGSIPADNRYLVDPPLPTLSRPFP